MWHEIEHALIDSLKILPFLLIIYIAIELIETYMSKKTAKAGKGWSPILGAAFGIIPQCGFSVVATDLYSKKQITVGALLAVFIATSDEAIPVMISNPSKILSLIPLLVIKFVFAIIVGYSVNFALKKHNQKKMQTVGNIQDLYTPPADKNKKTKQKSLAKTQVVTQTNVAVIDEEKTHNHTDNKHIHDENESIKQAEDHHKGCCGHTIEETKQNAWKQYLLHPLIHTLKVFGFILAVNILFALILYWVGEDVFINFLEGSYYFAPLFACLIGLIPNCVSSVIITDLYIMGGIPFAACLAGLCVNAGIALVVLFKQNKNIKNNFLILATLFVSSLVLGYIVLGVQAVAGI